MNNFKINIFELISEDFFVEAYTKDEAIETALQMFFDSDMFFNDLHITANIIEDEEI